jgi:hypothetical protein
MPAISASRQLNAMNKILYAHTPGEFSLGTEECLSGLLSCRKVLAKE